MSEDLGRFNALPAGEAAALLLPCCDSRAWARRMAEGRPFQGVADLQETSDRIWRSLDGARLAGSLRRASADRREGEPLVRG